MGYKVGDKVRVKKDLKINEYYGGVRFAECMGCYRGKVYTITNIDDCWCRISYVYLLDTPSHKTYYWTDEMLESVDKETEKNKDKEILDYLLDKHKITKEDVEKEMNRNEEVENLMEDIVKECDKFTEYCASRGKCNAEHCKIYKVFKRHHKLSDFYNKTRCALIWYMLHKEDLWDDITLD